MNRIKLDDGSIKKEVVNKELIVSINSDMYVLLDDIKYKKYIFNLNDSMVNILCNFDDIKKDVCFEFNIYGGTLVLNNISSNCFNQKQIFNLKKTSSKVKIINSYLCYNKQEISVIVNHENEKTISEVYNCAVTKHDGSIKFNLQTKVNKGMKNSFVSQNGRIITLNKSNKNEINPVLLIDEIDCVANHSAFIGEFKDNELFYMLSRGIDKVLATKLLIYGFLIGIMEVSEDEKEKLKKIL